MRNHQWRLLFLLRRRSSSSSSSPSIYPPLSLHTSPPPFKFPSPRPFSSDLNVPNPSQILQIFTKSSTQDEIRLQLDSNNVSITDESLPIISENPEIVAKIAGWVTAQGGGGGEGVNLSSKGFNSMIGILGSNGFVKEFWDLIKIMKKKGFGLSKGTFEVVEEFLKNKGLDSELEKLRKYFVSKDLDGIEGSEVAAVCRIVRGRVWDEGVEKRIMDLGVDFSSDLVVDVLRELKWEPSKALILFRWIEEIGLVKHDEKTYNAMARVLGRGDYVDRFWNVVREMRDAGFEMEKETYVEALSDFVGMRMMRDAVDLYEFAMSGENKPPKSDCTFLLKKIAASKGLDMELFSKVVKVFMDGGNVLDDSHMNAVLKSLASVGRIGDSVEILDVMAGAGFKPSSALQSKMVFRLSSLGNKDAAVKLMESLEGNGCEPDSKTWTSLVQGHCVAGNLEEASQCFQRMVDIVGVASAENAFDILVASYCSKNEGVEAYRLLCVMVRAKDLKPSQTAYKTLIKKLLARSKFEFAIELLPLMKNRGFPPFVDPFVKHVSKSGTADDAMTLLKAMTIQKYPPTTLFLRIFEAFSKAGRFSEAQNLLAQCPRCIRENPDVLDLFASLMSQEGAASAAAIAS